MKNTDKETNLVISGDLGSIVISSNVVRALTKEILKEIPGIDEIQLNFFGKKTDSGKVSVSTNGNSNGISLKVSVCLGGCVPVQTVGMQIQERLTHEIPKLVGLVVDEVIVLVEKINL